MTEQGDKLSDTLLKINSLEELKSAIPSSITNKIAEGDTGIKRTIGLLVSLSLFAPAPSTFSRDAFDNIIAVNCETGELLPKEEQQKVLEVALEAGFIQRAQTSEERYTIQEELRNAVKRVVGEER